MKDKELSACITVADLIISEDNPCKVSPLKLSDCGKYCYYIARNGWEDSCWYFPIEKLVKIIDHEKVFIGSLQLNNFNHPYLCATEVKVYAAKYGYQAETEDCFGVHNVSVGRNCSEVRKHEAEGICQTDDLGVVHDLAEYISHHTGDVQDYISYLESKVYCWEVKAIELYELIRYYANKDEEIMEELKKVTNHHLFEERK